MRRRRTGAAQCWTSAFSLEESGEGTLRFPKGKCSKTILPRKTQKVVIWLIVPESDTGRLPEYGKALEITLVKELGNLAS